MKKQKPLISQRTVSRMLESAARCWRQQDYDQYFQILERASRLDPGNVGLLLDMGSARGARHQYSEAQECFDRAVRLAPNKGEVLVMAGTLCRGFDHYQMAKSFFERAIEQPDAVAETFAKLAELYDRFRLPDKAGQMVDRALAKSPGSALALLVRARLHRLAGRAQEAETTVRALLAGTSPEDWSTRVRGWYELGAILDHAERYDEAMAAFLQAKAMVLPQAAAYRAAQTSAQSRLKQMGEQLSAEMLKSWFDCGPASPPVRKIALLCGHPRSGTTLLEQVLDSHPGIVAAEETTIFNNDAYLPLWRGRDDSTPIHRVLDMAAAQSLRDARLEYFRHMEEFRGEAIGDRLLVDKNPSLTALIPAMVRIMPECRFIVVLRDPRDVCLSCFMQCLPLSQASSSFLRLEDTITQYVSAMDFWRRIKPRMPTPCLEVRYEQVVQNLERVSGEVLKFLGLNWDDVVLRFDEHASKKLVRSPTYADVTRPISKAAVGRWRNYLKYFEPWLAKLEPLVRDLGYE